MLSVFYQIVYWLKNLTGLILTVRLESVKNVKFPPRQNFPLYGSHLAFLGQAWRLSRYPLQVLIRLKGGRCVLKVVKQTNNLNFGREKFTLRNELQNSSILFTRVF